MNTATIILLIIGIIALFFIYNGDIDIPEVDFNFNTLLKINETGYTYDDLEINIHKCVIKNTGIAPPNATEIYITFSIKNNGTIPIENTVSSASTVFYNKAENEVERVMSESFYNCGGDILIAALDAAPKIKHLTDMEDSKIISNNYIKYKTVPRIKYYGYNADHIYLPGSNSFQGQIYPNNNFIGEIGFIIPENINTSDLTLKIHGLKWNLGNIE